MERELALVRRLALEDVGVDVRDHVVGDATGLRRLEGRASEAALEQLVPVVRPRRSRPWTDEALAVPLERIRLGLLLALEAHLGAAFVATPSQELGEELPDALRAQRL